MCSHREGLDEDLHGCNGEVMLYPGPLVSLRGLLHQPSTERKTPRINIYHYLYGLLFVHLIRYDWIQASLVNPTKPQLSQRRNSAASVIALLSVCSSPAKTRYPPRYYTGPYGTLLFPRVLLTGWKKICRCLDSALPREPTAAHVVPYTYIN